MNNHEITLELTKIIVEARKNVIFDGVNKEIDKIIDEIISIYKKIFDEVKKLDN